MSEQEKSSSSGEGGQAKKITMEQLQEHDKTGDLWLLMDGKVYDVSNFMDEHPGGDEVLTSEAGKDCTEAFEDVGHSDDARSLLPPMLVGELEGAVQKAKQTASSVNQSAQKSGNPLLMFIPLLFLGAYFAYRHMQ
ncbi:cytochrome b5 [Microstroma glucosiphilum]|uniref:Cytochrome b5 n=1 Tax=Pseudomicrostroma glucosiphilum TaxID=1684307 RepID=A0A316U1Q5_9BASI|nr:cytochrome b5 [Pseudomicrostroma glucosiphilum]PWN19217.1 cytochrome b5 [Pseudomicrostroma glucosiphilum]